MKKTKDKTESGPTFYQTPNGKFLPSVYASALGRYYPYGGTFDMPRQQMYMPLDVVNANGGPIYPQNPLLNKPKSLAYNNQKLKPGVTNLPEVPIHPPLHRIGDSNLENIWEIFDPSGFSSYNDVYNSYKKTGMSPETMLEIAGALPVVGKFGKIIKGMKLGTDTFKEAKLSKALGVMDKIGKVSSANDVIFPPSIELIRATQQKSKGGYLAPILPMHFDKGTKIFRDTTSLPFADGGKLMDFPAPSLSERETNINYNIYASMPGRYYGDGGYTVQRSNDRKGKTHVVTGPDGTKKYFGDPNMGEKSNSEHGKEAFYARHKHNLDNNPYFRAYARATWAMGGPLNNYKLGGQFLTSGGEYHRIYKNAEGDIMVNHPAEDKGQWDTINLTDKANAHTVAQGVAATKQWHAEHPNNYGDGGMIKRADGSYSQRGLWDNIRANRGSGKEPTKEMLAQERKIKSNQYGLGGHKAVFFATNVSEPGVADKDLTYPKDAYVYNNGGYVNPIKNSNLVNNFKPEGNMNFKSNAAYKAWLGYGHATGVFERTPGNQSVSIKGKSKNVEHDLGGYLMANGGGITPVGYPFNNPTFKAFGFANGGSFNNAGFQALPKEVQAKIRTNAFGEGGSMDPLTEFNEGGTHEENIMGGIPQGMGANGQPNLVEQGETKLDAENYIFSDRLKVTKDVAEDFNFPKNFVGKTFADVSKLMDRPNSRREHDTIEETAKKRDLQNLMEAQESFKEREVAKKMEEINSLDPTALQGMGQPQIPQSVESMGMPQGQPIDASQIPPEMLAQMPEAQQGAPVMACGGHMYRCGGKMYDFGGTVGTALKDYGLGIADETMSLVGLNNVIQDSAYSDSASGKFMKGYANVVGGIGQKVLPMAANMIAPGSGAIVSGVQQAAGQFNPGAEMTLEAKADMSKNYASIIPQAGGMYTPPNYAMGGSMYPGSETLGNMFLGGGPFEEEFTFDTNPSYRTNALKTPSLAELSEPNYYVQDLLPEQIRVDVPEPTRTTTPTNIEVPEEVMTMFNKSPEEIALMSNEEKTALLSQYDSALQKFNSKQDEKSVDLNFKQTPGQAAMQAAPAIYNMGIGAGLWGKPEYYKASDYTTAADIKPYEYNIDPQVKEAQKTYAQYNSYLRNMGLDAGAVATNLGAAANGRNEALGRLYTEKLNADAQNAYAAKMANKQIEQSNKAIGLNVDSMNRALKAAKLNYLQTGLGQVADIGRNNQLTDLQLKHLGVLSPDYAGEAKYTSGWQSMFDAIKNRRNNSEEKIN